jgi:hypothetical protein
MILIAPLIAGVAMVNPAPDESYRLLPALWRGLVACVVVGLGTMVALLPWAFRNHERLGSWIWTTTNSGITLYDGFNPGATGASDQRFLAEMPAARSMTECERSRFFGEAASRWARDNVSKLPLLSVKKVLRSWSPLPLSAEFGRPIYRIISAAYAIPFDMLVVVGLFSRRMTRAVKLLLVAPVVLITVIEIFSVGSIRYRIPAEAPLAVLAGLGVSDLLKCAASGGLAADPTPVNA